jgi:hypothetical protein
MENKVNRQLIFGERAFDYRSPPSWGKKLVATIFHLKSENIGSTRFKGIKPTKGNPLQRVFKSNTTSKKQSFDNGINLFI